MRLSYLRHPRRAYFKLVVDQFHKWLYNDERLYQTRWMGVPLQKLPLDMWVYQEIIWDTRPTLVVETGTMHGGSALYIACLLDLIGGPGRVVSIDIENRTLIPTHNRIAFLTGRSSTDPSLVAEVEARAQGERVMVVLDSDHTEPHVSAELAAYANLVTPGCYLVVEDTNVNGHPVLPDFGPGPMEALTAWAPLHPEFERTSLDERYFFSLNPGGYFRRRVNESRP